MRNVVLLLEVKRSKNFRHSRKYLIGWCRYCMSPCTDGDHSFSCVLERPVDTWDERVKTTCKYLSRVFTCWQLFNRLNVPRLFLINQTEAQWMNIDRIGRLCNFEIMFSVTGISTPSTHSIAKPFPHKKCWTLFLSRRARRENKKTFKCFNSFRRFKHEIELNVTS